MSDIVIKRMTHAELVARKVELDKVLEVLTKYSLEEVCQELGELSYLLGGSSCGTRSYPIVQGQRSSGGSSEGPAEGSKGSHGRDPDGTLDHSGRFV